MTRSRRPLPLSAVRYRPLGEREVRQRWLGYVAALRAACRPAAMLDDMAALAVARRRLATAGTPAAEVASARAGRAMLELTADWSGLAPETRERLAGPALACADLIEDALRAEGCEAAAANRRRITGDD